VLFPFQKKTAAYAALEFLAMFGGIAGTGKGDFFKEGF
jgi:hypothetical protein